MFLGGVGGGGGGGSMILISTVPLQGPSGWAEGPAQPTVVQETLRSLQNQRFCFVFFRLNARLSTPL